MAAARPSGEEEDIGRRRSYAIDAHELRRYRSHYSDATSAHERATSRARSRKSLGPPQGLARVSFEFKKFWRRQISVVVDQAYNRDHLALERTFLGYLRTSQALSMLGVIISQLFTLQKTISPDPHIGYFVTGKPLGAICQGAAMLTLLLGTFRWWRQQNAITRGKALAGGFELTIIGLVVLLLCLVCFGILVAIEEYTARDASLPLILASGYGPYKKGYIHCSPPAKMAWTKSTRIIVMLVIDIAFFIIELGVGVWVGSLALMADAFHMLNDIISLLVGLWAVKAAQKSSSDKYSFGWLRAEILGAFFNAVFLIALCLSIILEAITRFVNIATITNPQLILIVGSLGLASNIVGFFVLGGHGHSHGPEEHAHGHEGHTHGDDIRSAEEGQIGAVDIDTADESGRVGDVLPEAAVSRATRTPPRRSTDSGRERQLKFTSTDETASTSKGSDASLSLSKYGSNRSPRHKRPKVRSSSITSRLASEINIHPASFRQEIIEASRNSLDDIQSADDLDTPGPSSPTGEQAEPNEHSPLRGAPIDGHKQAGGNGYQAIRQDSWHVGHNHNKPGKEGSGGHGHNHADLGMRAMVLHVIGDALGNVGVIVSALIIWLTHSPNRFYADPAVSLFITIIILRSAIPLTSATAKILLQATPDHLDVNDIKEDIQNIPGVVSCHHVHIWQLSDSQIIASLHIQVAFPISEEGGAARYMQVSKAVRKCLHAYGIHSATIQPEFCLDSGHAPGDANGGRLDSESTARATPVDECLLECVDDCVGKGCCSTKSPPPTISGQHGGGGSQGSSSHGHAHPDSSRDHSHDGHTH
ncbi:hypothetical protein V497_08362 [Pseudogymnoascus sp. VKM F-4516 (FW-969)]|nr:hypothetical protein V497_08362 [Pseudogymnoascus sp. VKM F-4516 (FW-969)]